MFPPLYKNNEDDEMLAYIKTNMQGESVNILLN